LKINIDEPHLRTSVTVINFRRRLITLEEEYNLTNCMELSTTPEPLDARPLDSFPALISEFTRTHHLSIS
jgi:hypothetical protein